VGQGRRNHTCIYIGPQEKAEDNVHHGAHQRGARYEKIAGRTHHRANTEEEASDSNGTVSRMGSISPGIGRGSQDTYSTDPGRVHGMGQ
jgi:hypothetical protein